MISQEQTQAYQAGVEYLQQISAFLPVGGLVMSAAVGVASALAEVSSPLENRQMVDVMTNLRDRVTICTWIGQSIGAVNLRLQSDLRACDECFKAIDRRSIQIFAVPFAASIRLDGFCNIATDPISILVDVGRVAPTDWLSLVAHEYAHAHLGYAGHDLEYAKILSHLCLGLGLPVLSSGHNDTSLLYWPPYQPTIDPLAFWRGETTSC